MSKIVKVRKNERDEITDVLLDTGENLSINSAIKMTMNKEIENVTVAHSKNGQLYLRSYPNGTSEDNLDNLPKF